VTVDRSTSVLTLLTDFGERDSYVGQMKGVILSISAMTRIVDLTHQIPPQDVLDGAFQIATAWRAFPIGTVHVVVVDPGVGTDRRLVACDISGHHFVAPDNGILTFVMDSGDVRQAVHLDVERYWRNDVAPTFHGRDILASVAGHLCTGVSHSDVGTAIEPASLRRIDVPATTRLARGLIAPVLSIDHFGNCRTLVTRDHLPVEPERVRVRVRGVEIRGISGTYKDVRPGEPVAVFGSSGGLELAVNGGSAAGRYALRVRDPLQIEWD
jgi:S-adenosyl-L-methionine hydrolase (adenosine-forming)